MPNNSLGIAGIGTLLQIGDGGGTEAFTTIAEVGDIDWSGMKLSTVDITNHSSLSAFKEIVGSVIDPGTIKFPVNFVPTAATQSYQSGLLLYLKNRTMKNFQIVFPNTAHTTWTFSALITDFSVKAAVAGKLEGNFSLELSGVIGFS